ncbi:MAG: hypothetical protein COT81_02035 [Candidatus Buchananbacteria bacterium CG10_big_fil_rev_8_21_14_0_10_42_9]|uniref:Uncharacterized protein n=1 Tax=Candidatus Buchananbacteria bacterium CG10_big_fil_rev_8_21_14_0_10_42_9 TaxID=1974526 RepID=A0A2H0W1S8_9BACT|nr:MAG: hypothetical protein COT81_02035 [Candidatus Buchananbacteria bacterium CG10_big_fil_rev_8_21_14_0_10_42_9]
MSDASRRLQNMRQRERTRNLFARARFAVIKFRRNGDASGFPDVMDALRGRNFGQGVTNLSLAAFGPEDVDLTREEFEAMKKAYEDSQSSQGNSQ